MAKYFCSFESSLPKNDSKQAAAVSRNPPIEAMAMETLPNEPQSSSKKQDYAYRIAAAAAALFLLLTWISA